MELIVFISILTDLLFLFGGGKGREGLLLGMAGSAESVV